MTEQAPTALRPAVPSAGRAWAWGVALLVSGLLASVPQSWPQAWPLAVLAPAVLAAAVWRLPVRAVALGAWLQATAALAASTWWLFISLHTYGGLAAPLAVLAVWALSAGLSLYTAAAMALAAVCRTGQARWDIPLVVAAGVAAELARGLWFTGFPWAAAGYAQVDGPAAPWASWVGVYGMGAVQAAAAAGMAWAWLHRHRPLGGRMWVAAVAASPLLLGAGLPQDHTRPAGSLSVALVQTAVAQDEKFDPGLLNDGLLGLVSAMRNSSASLVVAPETAIPLLPQELTSQQLEWLRAALDRPDGPSAARMALVGIPLADAGGYTNAALAWSQGQTPADPDLYQYRKHHLVPFGEFIPWGFRWFVDLMHIPLGDFLRGAEVQAPLEWQGQRIGPNICYEDLFGEELARRFAQEGQAPTVLVNISNIAWFGRSVALEQHLHISRLRSLELQRPMLRATNTGTTAAIDHRGRVLAALPVWEPGVLEAEVEGRAGLTPYARWASTFGLQPLAGLVTCVLLMGLLRRRRGA